MGLSSFGPHTPPYPQLLRGPPQSPQRDRTPYQRQNAAQPILRSPSPGTILNIDRSHQYRHSRLGMDITHQMAFSAGASKMTSIVYFEGLSGQNSTSPR